ncbi:MFS transporter [Natronoglycomyces albus]|nr:MFS transporter [Natronoglycomyces albus]
MNFNLAPFREVAAIPKMKSLLFGGLLARLPYAATGLALTLYVRFGLEMSYFHAGLVGSLYVLGQAAGSTLMGRASDRFSLRFVIAITTVCSSAFWLSAPFMSYPVLLVAAFPAGMLAIPVFVVIRQPIAALVPEHKRRTAYSMDSICVETAFIISPSAATILATQVSPRLTLIVIGAVVIVAGTMLWLIDPPTGREAHAADVAKAPKPARGQWMRGPLIGMMFVGAGITIAAAGSDIAIVSLLEHHGQLQWAWVVLGAWALYSLIGAIVIGGSDRHFSPVILLGIVAVCTIPLGFIGHWALLALAFIPAGFFMAPAVASSTDRVSRLAPVSVRGEAMGMQGSAMTIGAAIGAPLVGWTVETFGAQWGFFVAGSATLLAVAMAAFLDRARGADSEVSGVPAPRRAPEGTSRDDVSATPVCER